MQAEKLHSILFTKIKPKDNIRCFNPAEFKDFSQTLVKWNFQIKYSYCAV